MASSDTARSGLRAVVTGASAGIGAELANLFAADGHDLVLVARREDKLREIAGRLGGDFGVLVEVCVCDLGEPDGPGQVARFCAQGEADVTFLVNNAGFGSTGPFAEQELSRQLAMIAVNVSALTALTGLILPGMLERGHGRVLNIGSTAGFQAGPYMATYYASKAFVNHFSEALWHETKGTGVSVTVSCPGPTATEFGAIAGNDRSRLFKGTVMDARTVAEQAYRAMMSGRRMIVHGARNRAMIGSQRISPRSVVQRVVARLNRE